MDRLSSAQMLEQAAHPAELQPTESKRISEILGHSALLLQIIGRCIKDDELTKDEALGMEPSRIHDIIVERGSEQRTQVSTDQCNFLFQTTAGSEKLFLEVSSPETAAEPQKNWKLPSKIAKSGVKHSKISWKSRNSAPKSIPKTLET